MSRMERGRENGRDKKKICEMDTRIRQNDTKLYNKRRDKDVKYEDRSDKTCNQI